MSGATCYDTNDFLKAMADEMRQSILFLLCDREMSVSELCQHLTISQPTVSHHLAVLRRACLVTNRREGRWIFYRANPACVAECCDEILAHFREMAGSEQNDRSNVQFSLADLGGELGQHHL